MLALENADEILQILDRFTKQKSKYIPPELEEYINYVAKTGDTVCRWPTVQYLFREKLQSVIKEFHDTTASIDDLPQCPNVDQSNYDSMKTLLFERFDNFQAAPFTIQRICELLTDPKKHYSRLDKFMRALEKTILVVSTVEPGRKPHEPEGNGDVLNGVFDNSIDMEINKTEKRSTNGTRDKHNECDSSEHDADEVASSSGISQITTESDVKKDVDAKEADDSVAEKSAEVEKPIEKTESEMETEETKEITKPSAEAAQTKTDEKIEEVVKDESKTAEKHLNVTPEKVNPTENVPVEAEKKSETAEESSIDSKDKNAGEDIKSEDEIVVNEKPPTPKHARSSSDDEEIDGECGSKNPCAKKIRLELDDEVEKVEEKIDSEPSIEPSIVDEVYLQKEAEILESISSEIDAQKENELLEDVVDATLAAEEDTVATDIPPIIEKPVETEVSKPTEGTSDADDLLKTSEPVTIPTDLDFTPDEALNELVSSDILSVIPEQPAEEVKMSDEPVNITEPVTGTDEMNVENPENNTPEVESAMESAPIKADEEQMDVDESNSVDAMDL